MTKNNHAQSSPLPALENELESTLSKQAGMAGAKVTVKITELGSDGWENIDKLFQLIELANTVKRGVLIDILEAWELIKCLENTEKLKDYPEFIRARKIIFTKIKFRVPRN